MPKKKQNSRKKIISIILFNLLTLVILIPFLYITIRFFSKDDGLETFGYSYIQGINYNEPIVDGVRYVRVFKIRKFEESLISNNDSVAIHYLNEEKDYCMIVKVIDNKYEADGRLVVSNNEYISELIETDLIIGEYVKEADLFGKLVYTSMELSTYLLIAFFTTTWIALAFYNLIYPLLVKKAKKEIL